MERKKIVQLSKKNISCENLEKTKKILEDSYEISYGKYSPVELKKAIYEESPLFIQNHFIIGYEKNRFINDNNEEISIDKMVKAIIVEDEIGEEEVTIEDARDDFIIIGQQEWNGNKGVFSAFLNNLKVGEIFLPPHSLVFNFLKPTEKQIKEKIVSSLSGINVNIYSEENYIDNSLHEIGHAFWRDCVNTEDKKRFKDLWKRGKFSSIYEYEWEKNDEEEMFCTIYKVYLKSLLINKSFANILEFEEPEGLNLLKKILENITAQKIANDIWNLNKEKVDSYLNPIFDKTTGKYIIKHGLYDEIKDIEIPESILNNIKKIQNGLTYINLNKAVVPVKDKKIAWDSMKKAKDLKSKIIYLDMDGVVADFNKYYKDSFNRDATKDDSFTGFQFVSTKPDFFFHLPVIEKGRELFNKLIEREYQVVFLTTPMQNLPTCKIDKYNWILNNFGEFDVIFEKDKYKYVTDDQSILIDDRNENLERWTDAGGTAIKFPQKIDKILNKIDEVFNDEIIVKDMDVNTSPTESQKQSGIYKKGKVNFKGLDIRIENPKGSIRWGFSETGKKWINKMKHHYGYITGTEGTDYDPVDVFIGDKSNASRAFVVNQFKSNMFDEHKIMLGFNDIEEAKKAYLSNYEKGWDGLGSIIQTNTKKIREWLKEKNNKEPFKN